MDGERIESAFNTALITGGLSIMVMHVYHNGIENTIMFTMTKVLGWNAQSLADSFLKKV